MVFPIVAPLAFEPFDRGPVVAVRRLPWNRRLNFESPKPALQRAGMKLHECGEFLRAHEFMAAHVNSSARRFRVQVCRQA